MKKESSRLMSILLCFIVLSSSVIASTLTIRPNSQGSYTNWLNIGCSSGNGEWDCVDENPANNSNYLYAYTANNKESFNFGNVNLTSEHIYGIELFYNAKRYSSTKYYLWPLFKINSTDFTGSSLYTGGTSYVLRSKWVQKNPLTKSAWTVSDINNLEAGMKLLNYPYAGAYVSQMYINVDYDSPSAYPDLTVSRLTFNEYNVVNNQTNKTYMRGYVYTTIKNAGLDTADVSTTRIERLSTEDRSTSMLRPTKTQSFSFTYNCTAPHNFIVTADIGGVITESNEANNVKTVYIDCVI